MFIYIYMCVFINIGGLIGYIYIYIYFPKNSICSLWTVCPCFCLKAYNLTLHIHMRVQYARLNSEVWWLPVRQIHAILMRIRFQLVASRVNQGVYIMQKTMLMGAGGLVAGDKIRKKMQGKKIKGEYCIKNDLWCLKIKSFWGTKLKKNSGGEEATPAG